MASFPVSVRRPAGLGILLSIVALDGCGGEPRRAAVGTESPRPAAQTDSAGSPGQCAQAAGLDPVEYFACLTGITIAQASPLLRLVTLGTYNDSAVVAALEPWIGAARSLAAPRRAAALLAADLVVARWVCPIPEPDTSRYDHDGERRWMEEVSGQRREQDEGEEPEPREEAEQLPEEPQPEEQAREESQESALDRLVALGAGLRVQSESGEGLEAHCLYTRNWATEALALVSLRVLGDSAYAMLLLRGDALGDINCPLPHQWVISEAQRLRQRVTDSTTLAQLDSLLAAARSGPPPHLQWC